MSIGIEILNFRLHSLNRKETQESELKEFFMAWLSLSVQTKGFVDENIDNLQLEIQTKGAVEMLDKDKIDCLLPRDFKSLLDSALKSEYVYNYGDWIVEYVIRIFTLCILIEKS